MSPKLLRLSRFLLLVALFFGAGGHWVVLQTVAWSSMVVDYSRNAPVTEAVSKTFDGRHPCGLCGLLVKSQSREKKEQAPVMVKKMELFHETCASFLAVRTCEGKEERIEAARPGFAPPPLVPPPRAA